MKRKCMFLAVLGCLLMTTQAFGFDVAIEPDGSFSLLGPRDNFSNWAIGGGGVTYNDFFTWWYPTHSEWYSGYDLPNTWADMTIPFNFSAPVVTARIDYSAICIKYGYNWGECNVRLKDSYGIETPIFHKNADSTGPNYNYTASQTPDEELGFWVGYTDITPLVSGQTSFSLTFEVFVGDSSYTYNGGQFFPGGPDSVGRDFVLTGTAAAPISIAEAKKWQDGSLVSLQEGIVTAAFTDYFYIESPDRSMGIRVEKAAHGLQRGAKRTVLGTIYTNSDSERYIQASEVAGSGTGSILPLGMNNKSIGGGDYHFEIVE